MKDVAVQAASPRMAAFLIAGAALVSHAAMSRALPNHALGATWAESLSRQCARTPGCVRVQVTPSTGFLYWSKRRVEIAARPGQETAVLSRLQDAIGIVGKVYSDVRVSPASGSKK